MLYNAVAHARMRAQMVARMPERKLTPADFVEDGPACSICLEYYKVADKIRKILPCGHGKIKNNIKI